MTSLRMCCEQRLFSTNSASKSIFRSSLVCQSIQKLNSPSYIFITILSNERDWLAFVCGFKGECRERERERN